MAKELKPVLTGQRLKARKRDVKEKFNREEFRDDLMEGLIENEDIDGATKFFENNTRKFDYRQYDDALFDIIVAGGILAPGGSIVNDGADLNPFSVFETDNDLEAQKAIAEMIRALVRRYKYLQVSLEDSFIKLLKFLGGYSAENLLKLAHNTAFLLSYNLISGKVLSSVTSIDSVVAGGQAKVFLTTLLQTWFGISTVQQIGTVLRKANLDQKIADFFPINERSSESIIAHFKATQGLELMVGWYIGQLTAEVKAYLVRNITTGLREGETEQVLVDKVRAVMQEHKIPESEIVKLVWSGLMQSVEWSKKPDMATEQALRHVRDNLNFLGSFMKSDRAQIVLLITMQEHAFVNQIFLKIFSRFCLMMYKADYLGEDAIIQWYTKDHSQKGKMAFLEEMKKFVDWFATAEEEDE